MREKHSAAFLRQEAARHRQDALTLIGTIDDLPSTEKIRRICSIQKLYDKARLLDEKSREAGR